MEGVYPDATPGYAAILSAAYEDRPERLVRAVGQAKGVAHLRGIADPLFVNRRLPVRAMGLVAAGFPAWKGEVGWARFDEVHPLLEGSLLVDPAAFASRPPGRDYVSGYSRDINARTVRTGGGEVVSILPAFHVDALVALSLADLRGLLGLDPIDREPHLRLTYDGERLDYYALRLSRFTEFSPEQLARLSHPAFFVIGWEHAGALRFPSWEGVRARWEEEPVGR